MSCFGSSSLVNRSKMSTLERNRGVMRGGRAALGGSGAL
jgi:hypothetical protein